MIQGTENQPFGDLVSRRVPFVVPKYQRAYAWEDNEIQEFIHDISELYASRLKNPSQPMSHFFGGLVSVHLMVPNTNTGRVYEVVDGQQRLSTFLLTMAAIIEGLEQIERDAQNAGDTATATVAKLHAADTKQNFVSYDEVVGSVKENRLRLSLSKADNDFFQHLMNNQGGVRKMTVFERDSHRRLQRAWKAIYKALVTVPILDQQRLSQADRIERLLKLRACMTEDCHLIHVVSDNLNEAYRLFAVLNDRGKTLSDGDLLRSYTLETLEGHPSIQSQVETSWDALLSYKDAQIEQFIRSYYPSKTGTRAPKRELANTFREKFFVFPKPLQLNNASTIRDMIGEMSREARIFDNIMDGKWPYDNPSVTFWDTNRLHRLIRVLKHTLCLPLLLSAHRHLDETQFANMVILIERFSFRYITVVGAHPSRLGDIYNSYAKAIEDNPTTYDVSNLKAELKTLQTTGASDDQFAVGLKAKLVYSTPTTSSDRENTPTRILIRHFLTTIDDHLVWYDKGANGDPRPDKSRLFALDQVTIEHIYPRTPRQGEAIPALDPYTHTIGNLSFWGPHDNSAAGNLDFASKKPMYGSSHVYLNRDLSQYPTWDETTLLARQARLFDIAKKIFTA